LSVLEVVAPSGECHGSRGDRLATGWDCRAG